MAGLLKVQGCAASSGRSPRAPHEDDDPKKKERLARGVAKRSSEGVSQVKVKCRERRIDLPLISRPAVILGMPQPIQQVIRGRGMTGVPVATVLILESLHVAARSASVS